MSKTDRDILRDEVYMNMAHDISGLSKDKNTKIGCVIVAEDKTPVSWGYNGAIAGSNDDIIPHSREEQTIQYIRIEEGIVPPLTVTLKHNKYPFMSHAEANAIYFADRDKLKGATLYVTAYPCEECAKSIARAGIKRVVIETPKTIDTNSIVKQVNHLSECIMAQKNIDLCVDGHEIKLRSIQKIL